MSKLLNTRGFTRVLRGQILVLVAACLILPSTALSQEQAKKRPRAREAQLPYPPPVLFVTDTSPEFLKPPEGAEKQPDGSYKIKLGLRTRRPSRQGEEQAEESPEQKPPERSITFMVAKTPPTVDFTFYPGQDYVGEPWSVWGDGTTIGDKYYSAIGDHRKPKGTARIFEYDPDTKQLRMLVDLKTFLESSGAVPAEMNYTPGKVHCRIVRGKDGWLYYATHRGSPKTTNDAHGYKGDWIFRTDPKSGKTEIVATHPVPKHCIPAGFLDPERMIFYGGTAAGDDAPAQGVQFLAYDVVNRNLLKAVPGGFKRCAIFSSSTGKVYFDGKVYDPATNDISECKQAPWARSATLETPDGIVYGTTDHSAEIWAFNVRTETLTRLGSGAVGRAGYTTTIDADPSGRYLYYIPGAHGGTAGDGTPIIQFDVKTKTKKVIAFLGDFYKNKYGYTFDGTFGSALSESGDKLYVTWNGWRKPKAKGWESCTMTVIHIPESERRP